MECNNVTNIVQVNDGDDLEMVATLTDKEGKAVDPLSLDWCIIYYVYPNRAFEASNCGGVLTNCSIVGGEIHVYINRFLFGSGRLLSRAWFSFPNEHFEDGAQDVSTIAEGTGIVIV